MQRMSPARRPGWVTLDALLALGLWSALGLSLVWQTRALLVQQRQDWQQAQAADWLADGYERLRLAHLSGPHSLAWGQQVSGTDCISNECDPASWRDSLLADWQNRVVRDLPQAQTWLAPWSQDARLQVLGLRWPQRGTSAQKLPLNGETCPSDWRCLVALVWP